MSLNGQQFAPGHVTVARHVPVAVAELSPSGGPVGGGTRVLLSGAFSNSSALRCRFGADLVAPTYLNASSIACVAPPSRAVANDTPPLFAFDHGPAVLPECYEGARGGDYRGHVNTTATGQPCQVDAHAPMRTPIRRTSGRRRASARTTTAATRARSRLRLVLHDRPGAAVGALRRG